MPDSSKISRREGPGKGIPADHQKKKKGPNGGSFSKETRIKSEEAGQMFSRAEATTRPVIVQGKDKKEISSELKTELTGMGKRRQKRLPY